MNNRLKGFVIFICVALMLIFFGEKIFSFMPFIFIGFFIFVVTISINKTKKNVQNLTNTKSAVNIQTPSSSGISLKCAKCGNNLEITHKFCGNCGAAFDGNNVTVVEDPNSTIPKSQENYVSSANYDKMFSLTEEQMIEEFINRELVKAKIDSTIKLIPSDINKRKKIFNIIFSSLVFIYIILIFFHFPLYTYLIGLILLFIFFKLTRGYNLMKYLKKQLKARPSEKVSNIVMSVKTSLVSDNSRPILLIGLIVAIVLPLIIFIKPVILYEKMEGGYGVRYYAFGVTNFTKATIPSTHKGENVVSLRGNTFSNMPLLKEINLPDTIIEIRGQAFKNVKKLENIKLPSNLFYLGGGAFYNCTSLKSIEMPDTVTYLGGEAFYNAKSLESVKLSNNLTEIRGSTFENCESLKSIEIPDKVTRIGGHAFYGNASLSSVYISQNSNLKEIGSSAFRRCYSLYEITIPYNAYVNERSFKESPTEVKTYSMANQFSCQYDAYFVMKIGDIEKINKYKADAIIQDEYLNLISVIENNGSYEFTFDVNGQQFTLTKLYKQHKVNNNLIVEINSDLAYEYYNNQISIDVYYN